MIMKRNLQFLSLLLLMIVGKTSFAWAQTTIVVIDQMKNSNAGTVTLANGSKTVAYSAANNSVWYMGTYDLATIDYIEAKGLVLVDRGSDGKASLNISVIASDKELKDNFADIDPRASSATLAKVVATTTPTSIANGKNATHYAGANFKITTTEVVQTGTYDGTVDMGECTTINKITGNYHLFIWATAQKGRMAIDEMVVHLKGESGEQQTVKLNPTKDTQIRLNNTTNNAAKNTVEVRTQYKDGNLDSDFIGLFGFDLSSVPASATIEEATLRLVTERYKGGDRGMNIYDYPSTFAENTIYSTEAANVVASRESGTITTFNIAGSNNSITDGSVPEDYRNLAAWTNTIDLKSYVQTKAGSAVGLMITSNANNANQKCIYTKEAENVTNTNFAESMSFAAEDLWPLLTVTYTQSTASMLSYEMTVSEANAATLMLPFATTIPDGVKVYTLNYTAGSDAVTATEITTGTLPANTPVLVNATAGNYTFNGINNTATKKISTVGALTGVCAKTIVPENSFILTNVASSVGFRKVDGSTNTVAANRCYLTADGAPARLSIVYDDEATGIETMNKVQDTMNNEVYDLQGRRVSQPTKGLYIVNGKKVILK